MNNKTNNKMYYNRHAIHKHASPPLPYLTIDEPGEEHFIDEDFHGEFDENLFQDSVADVILDPDLNINNPNMEGTGHQGPQSMVVVDPVRNLPKFSGEKTEPVNNHLDAFDD